MGFGFIGKKIGIKPKGDLSSSTFEEAVYELDSDLSSYITSNNQTVSDLQSTKMEMQTQTSAPIDTSGNTLWIDLNE